MRRLRPALLAVLLSVPCLPALGLGAERVVDYLYLDANEGGAAGGHTGVRLGDDVFHFEYRRPGLLVLRRESFEEFRRQYGGVENRTIEVRRIPVSDTAYARLRDRLTRRHLVQRQHLEALETLSAGRRILDEIRAGRVLVEGAGYFADAGDGDERVPEPALVALRRRVVDTYGAEALTERRQALRARLAALAPAPGPSAPPVAPDEMPALAYEFPQRYRDTLTALAALDLLDAAPPLAAAATITGAGEDLRVREDEAAVLPRVSDALASGLVRLLGSRRPDWGDPLILGMARLAALARTQSSGRWVFLDTFRSDSRVLDAAAAGRKAHAMAASARRALDAARARLVARADGVTFAEPEFADLEDAGNRVAEIAAARDGGRALRLERTLLPARAGARPAAPAPAPEILAAAVTAVADRDAAYRRAIERDYRYHLAARNCVSELLREMDAALLGDDTRVSWPVDFIPAASAAALGERYPITEVFRIPSRRQAALERMYDDANPLTVFLRESNTLTSTLYRRHDDESVFLLFTDDLVLTRPLFGAVNLLTGVAATVAGVATLPFDEGRLLRAGARGAVFSLPELFFQNIRKGSTP